MFAWCRACVVVLSVVVAGCTGSASGPVTSPSARAGLVPTPTPPASADPYSTPTSEHVPLLLAEPTGVTFDVALDERAGGRYAYTHTVTWQAPGSEDIEIRVLGVTECLAEPTSAPDGSTGPCVVEDAPLPSSVLELAATAPASDGRASWTWIDESGGCDTFSEYGPDGTGYEAVVLAAYSAAGHSIFAIAEPGAWWSYGPDVEVMPC